MFHDVQGPESAGALELLHLFPRLAKQLQLQRTTPWLQHLLMMWLFTKHRRQQLLAQLVYLKFPQLLKSLLHMLSA